MEKEKLENKLVSLLYELKETVKKLESLGYDVEISNFDSRLKDIRDDVKGKLKIHQIIEV